MLLHMKNGRGCGFNACEHSSHFNALAVAFLLKDFFLFALFFTLKNIYVLSKIKMW